jgi:hypothetical protein
VSIRRTSARVGQVRVDVCPQVDGSVSLRIEMPQGLVIGGCANARRVIANVPEHAASLISALRQALSVPTSEGSSFNAVQ